MSRVLRILHGDSADAARLIDEQAFIAEVEAPVQGAHPPLPCTVESIDGLGRLRWRAYCSTREGLLDLARQLGQERSMAARAGGPHRAS
ncbi:MAG TPA: hypothetical protein VK509_21870 [Polyangiales bacterium]|nr:hypothetical protein [Polyangiales bacterium]